ncbi:MAG: restriction endonuclease subunit S [Candidatus Helarchaeota archaeon]
MITGFKKTKIGDIPEEWNITKLGELCELKKDPIVPSGNGILKYIGLEHIDSGSSKIINWGLENQVRSTKFRFSKGDILYGKLRPYLNKCVIANFDGICSTDIMVIKVNSIKILPYYLLNVMHLPHFVSYSTSRMKGVNHPRVSWSDLSKFKIPIPSFTEQQKIAEILATVDEAIQQVETVILKTERLKRGLMQELLTNGIGHTRFKQTKIGQIPEEWEIVKLGDEKLIKLIMGQSPPSLTYNKNKVGLPFFQGKNEFGYIYPTPSIYCSKPIKIAEEKDILLSVRAPVGDVNIAPFKCCIGRGLSAIRVINSELNYLFLFYYLQYYKWRFKSISMGSTFKAIRKTEIENFKLPLPTPYEQQKITEILASVDKKLELERERKKKLIRIKAGLMNDLLTGKKRVNVGG